MLRWRYSWEFSERRGGFVTLTFFAEDGRRMGSLSLTPGQETFWCALLGDRPGHVSTVACERVR